MKFEIVSCPGRKNSSAQSCTWAIVEPQQKGVMKEPY